MAGMPEIADRDETEKRIAVQLDELEKLMQEAENLRRKQFLVSAVTILLMLVVLSVFIIGLISYFRTYPKRLLMREVIEQNRRIMDNPYHFGITRKYDRKLIHGFMTEMQKELYSRQPVFRRELRTGILSIHEYAATELRSRFQGQLYIRLKAKTRQYLKEKNCRPDRCQTFLLRQLNTELAASVTDRLFGNPTASARQNFTWFQEEIEHLRQSGMYWELHREPLELVEERMFENLLECLVCRLNNELPRTGKKGGKEP